MRKQVFLSLFLSTVLLFNSRCVYADFPTAEELFGTVMPSVSFALGREADEVTIDMGRFERYDGVSYKDYEEIGRYLDLAGCTRSLYGSEGETIHIDIKKNGKVLGLHYDYAEKSLTVFYPEGTRPEKQKNAGEISGRSAINILPYFENIFGEYLPSVAVAVQRAPDSQVIQDDNTLVHHFESFSDDDYNLFSKYLTEKECSVKDYTTDNNVMTISLEHKGRPFTFAYDRNLREATVTYPDGEVPEQEFDCELMGHFWLPATCTAAETCSVCGKTEGFATGHTYKEWITLKAATLTQDGERKGICSVCGAETVETVTRRIATDEMITTLTWEGFIVGMDDYLEHLNAFLPSGYKAIPDRDDWFDIICPYGGELSGRFDDSTHSYKDNLYLDGSRSNIEAVLPAVLKSLNPRVEGSVNLGKSIKTIDDAVKYYKSLTLTEETEHINLNDMVLYTHENTLLKNITGKVSTSVGIYTFTYVVNGD